MLKVMPDRISRLTVFIFQTPHTVSCVVCVGALSDPSHGLLCALCGSTLRSSHLLLCVLCGSTLSPSQLLRALYGNTLRFLKLSPMCFVWEHSQTLTPSFACSVWEHSRNLILSPACSLWKQTENMKLES